MELQMSKFETEKKVYQELIHKHGITGGRSWLREYKLIGRKEGLKLLSTPWKFFNMSIKEFFDEIFARS